MGYIIFGMAFLFAASVAAYCVWRWSNKDFSYFSDTDHKEMRRYGRCCAGFVAAAGFAAFCILSQTGFSALQQEHRLNTFIAENPSRFSTLQQAKDAFYQQQEEIAYIKYVRDNSL